MDLGHHQLSSKYSKSREEKESANVEMHGETFVDSIKDKKEKKKSKTTGQRQRSKDLSYESESNFDSEGEIDVIDRGKNNHSVTHINGSSSSSSSSFWSESPSDYKFFTMVETFNYTKSEKDNVSSIPTSTYQSHNQNDTSPTASPSIQVMDRSGGYDTSSIPSSIFEANTNPSEWSIGSNDSLFSIPLGQSSFFTRENTPVYDESDLFGAPSVIQEEIISTSIKTSVDVENLQKVEIPYGSFKLEGETLAEGDNEIETSHQPSKPNVSIISQTSDNAISSVTFPVKLAKFYNCRWVFCDLWSRCECWNRCRFSCCWKSNHTKHWASPILTKVESSDSMKMDIPRQQSKKQKSKVNSNSSNSCCNSFSCPFCCTWNMFLH